MICGGIALIFCSQKFLFALVNTHNNYLFDKLMVYITMMGEGYFGVSIMLLLLTQRNYRNHHYFFAAIFCNAVPAIMVQLIKAYYNTPRPMAVYNKAKWIHILPNWEVLMENSFPSGHTSAAFCLFAFLSMLLTEQYKKFGLLFFLFAFLVAYSRLYLAAHFFLDVYVSSLIAVSFATAVMYLIKTNKKYKLNV
jgi:membrane-associated phospholipid phosphatase